MNSKNILIFAGAGASKSVAPELYPTTVEFFKQLPKSITSNPLFSMVEEFIKGVSKSETIDIELILWQLQELKKLCDQIRDQSQFPGWMLANSRLVGVINNGWSVGQLDAISHQAIGMLDGLIGEINALVYELYSKLPSQEQLQNTWLPLINTLEEFGRPIEIVTTNYDLIIEEAIDLSKVVDNGWRGNTVRTLKMDLWSDESHNRKKGLLTKLHGSVNWTRSDNQINISDPYYKGSHNSHVIIYPGFKGKPTEPVFQDFHTHFRKSLESSCAVIFIGFAFRDEYINDICERAITTNTITSVINPAKVDLPFSSQNTHYVEAFFDKEAVASVSKFIGEQIKMKAGGD